MIVGVASLIGLPLLGGSVGTLLVAQSAANHSGWWLFALLVGNLLAGAGWLLWRVDGRGLGAASEGAREKETRGEGPGERAIQLNAVTVMVIALLVAQVALFVASARIESVIAVWGDVPWISMP
jgi:NADH:ubiquinone oxidoreductase subunit 2 (subunit N)